VQLVRERRAKIMIGNERKQLIERELGIHPIGVFFKRKKKPVGKRRVNVEALPYFSVPKMLGTEKLGRPLRLHVSFTVVSSES
jgi:hypothetical protein